MYRKFFRSPYMWHHKYFQKLFSVSPSQHPIVVLKDVAYQDLRSVIDFMYHGEVNVTPQQLHSVLKVSFEVILLPNSLLLVVMRRKSDCEIRLIDLKGTFSEMMNRDNFFLIYFSV